jgi:hypothetical protein
MHTPESIEIRRNITQAKFKQQQPQAKKIWVFKVKKNTLKQKKRKEKRRSDFHADIQLHVTRWVQ